MALTYQTAYDLTANAVAVQRVTVAVVQAAVEIYVEAPPPTNAVARKLLATKVLNNPEPYGRLFIFVCVVNATIVAKSLATVTDADLLAAVKGAWDSMAGA